MDKDGNERGFYITSGIPANATVQIRTSLGQCVNHNTIGTNSWEYFNGRQVAPSDPTLKITGRAEMPSLEIYHESLSLQELKVWNHKISDAQQLSEDHMDDSLSNRALTTGLPPTNLSYAEFFGMRVRTLSYLHLKNDDKEYDLFLPGKTPSVLLDTDVVRGSDSDDEAIPVKAKGKGKGKKGKGRDKPKGKGKGRGRFNPTLVHPDHIDPLKLVWKPRRKEQVPVKGAGRDNYRALRSETLRGWLHDNEYQRVLEAGGDVESIRINLEDYPLPDVTPVTKKPKDSPKRQRENVEDPESKRVEKEVHLLYLQHGGISILVN